MEGYRIGNGPKPTSDPTQLGICRVAPLLPQLEQRTRWRSTSLEAFGPQRMIAGANAIGARRKRVQLTHTQHWCRRS